MRSLFVALVVIAYIAGIIGWFVALIEAARAARVGWVLAIVLLPLAFVFWFFSSARQYRV